MDKMYYHEYDTTHSYSDLLRAWQLNALVDTTRVDTPVVVTVVAVGTQRKTWEVRQRRYSSDRKALVRLAWALERSSF